MKDSVLVAATTKPPENAMASKYDPITKLLFAADARGERELTVSFDELDAIIPGGLPASARNHRAWWSNSSQYGSVSWAPYGWVVDTVNQSTRGWVRFRRIGAAIATGTSAPGASQSTAPQHANGPADEEPDSRCPADAVLAVPAGPTGMQTNVQFFMRWGDAGPITVDDAGRIAFPLLPALPGIYRIEMSGAPGQQRPIVYVGETDIMFRRMTGYRSPGPTQSTNIRLNALLSEHLRSGGAARLEIATECLVHLGGPDQPLRVLDLSRKFARRLAENAALVAAQLGGDIDLVNADVPSMPAA